MQLISSSLENSLKPGTEKGTVAGWRAAGRERAGCDPTNEEVEKWEALIREGKQR